MSEHFNGSMRRSLLSIFVADLSLLLVVVSFFIDGPWTRLGAVAAGLLLPTGVFVLTSGPFARLAANEWRRHTVRSAAAFLAVLLGSAAVAVSVGVRPESDAARRVVAVSQGGPADIVVESVGAADKVLVAEAIAALMKQPNLQQMFDAEPLQLRWAPAWIRTTDVHRVRVISLDIDTARRFGGDSKWTGLATANAGKGVTLSRRASRYLSVGSGSSPRFDLLAGRRTVPLTVLQVVGDAGLIGIPGSEGAPEPTLFVDTETFDRMRAEGWTDPVRDWSVLSLCGQPQQPAPQQSGPAATKESADSVPDGSDAEALAERRCTADPWNSLAYSDRIEEELNLAIVQARSTAEANVPAATITPTPVSPAADVPADDVLFDQPGDGDGIAVVQFDDAVDAVDEVGGVPTPPREETSPSGLIRVDPVKRLAVDRGVWSSDRAPISDRLVGALLGTGAIVTVIAGCFVDRRRRSARERFVGVSGASLAGTWAIVVGLSALPGAVVGAAAGTLLLTLGRRIMFRFSSVPWTNAFSSADTFAAALSWCLLACCFVAVALSVLTQKIPLVQAVRGAPLMTARRWLPVGLLSTGAGLVLLVNSGGMGTGSQIGLGLLGLGAGVLAWSIFRSRWVVAGVGVLVTVASVASLHRTWTHAPGADAHIGSLVGALLVVIGGLAGAYAATAPGQAAARLGVPPNEVPALAALRTRVATRPGPWPLSPLVGAVLAMTTSCVAASVLIASPSGSQSFAGQRDGVVLQEPVMGAAQGEIAAVSSLEAAEIVELRTSVLSGIVPAPNPEVPAPDHRRTVTVGSLGPDTDQWNAVLGSAASASLRAEGEGAVVVAEAFRSVFGTVPSIGSTIRLVTAGGAEQPVVVAAVIERAPGRPSLWVRDQQFDTITEGVPFEQMVFAHTTEKVDALRGSLERALVGTGVAVADSFFTRRPPSPIESFLHRLLDLVVGLHLITAAVLVWRWSSERRQALLSTRNAALGPAFLARSVNQDATAHVGVAAVLGSAAGLILGWAVLPTGANWSPGFGHLAVIAIGPALVAALVARMPSVSGKGRSAG